MPTLLPRRLRSAAGPARRRGPLLDFRLTPRERLEQTVVRTVLRLPLAAQRTIAGRLVQRDGQTIAAELQLLLRLEELSGGGALDPAAGRREMTAACVYLGGRQPIGDVRELKVDGGAGKIAARLYTPSERVDSTEPAPLLVFVHGGGMIRGDLDSHDATCRFLAERADVLVLSLDYRLAPESPFPAGLEDCEAAYRWVVDHVDELGADRDRLAVGGDSAGGYFAALMALMAAREGLPCAFQLLLYPVTDMVNPTESRRLFAQGFGLTKDFMDAASALYAPGGDLADPRISVLLTPSVPAGLAPAYVATAGFDPLRDEGEAYARKLAAAGVPVELKRFSGMVHGFTNFVGVGHECPANVAEIAAKLKAALAG